jgi:hypothetical protein
VPLLPGLQYKKMALIYFLTYSPLLFKAGGPVKFSGVLNTATWNKNLFEKFLGNYAALYS